MAAQRIIVDHSDVLAAGVVESMSGVPNGADRHPGANPWRVGHKAEFYGSMLQAAEQVAKLDKVGPAVAGLDGVRRGGDGVFNKQW